MEEETILKLLFFTLVAFVQPGFANSGQPDPRIGSWVLVSAQSALAPPNQLSVVDAHGALHVVISGEKHLDFTAKADGRDSAVQGNAAFNQVEMRGIDKKQTEVKQKKDGALVATIRTKLSSDGKELTVTTASKGRPDEVEVWIRTGGAKAAHDPLAGEWVQDMSKTRMRQATPLKIEADGNGGVRFLGDFSYTARFDGKPYEVKNSRNDTVALQLVDPHTVDAVYRRDDQVTQKDRWAISLDGQQMTLTSTATLETGQHLTEKLVFKRQ
jgi:hypothetical protein